MARTPIPWKNPYPAGRQADLYRQGYLWAHSPCGGLRPVRSDLSEADEAFVQEGYRAARIVINIEELADLAPKTA